MKKVVYNACYGGFGLSCDGLLLLKLRGFPLESFPLEGSGYTEADFPLQGPDDIRGHARYAVLLQKGICYTASNLGYGSEADTLRSHPILVQVVEELGARASGSCAKLAVDTLDNNALYRISEYDGYESVEVLSADNYVFGHCLDDLALPAPQGVLTLFTSSGTGA